MGHNSGEQVTHLILDTLDLDVGKSTGNVVGRITYLSGQYSVTWEKDSIIQDDIFFVLRKALPHFDSAALFEAGIRRISYWYEVKPIDECNKL
jgi:hypothetical protein